MCNCYYYDRAVHISVAVDMRTLLDRKNCSSSSNGQVAAHRVTGLIIKRLWLYQHYLSILVFTRHVHFQPYTSMCTGRASSTNGYVVSCGTSQRRSLHVQIRRFTELRSTQRCVFSAVNFSFPSMYRRLTSTRSIQCYERKQI